MTDAQDVTLASSRTVKTVFEQILDAVNDGTLLPGERISDGELARQLGVSRTPVREALQRLREIGVIEAAASRFTRVAEVTPAQTAQSYVVWLALFRALLTEIVPVASAELAPALEDDHARYIASLETLDAQQIATANFMFFNRLSGESTNPALQRAITSVVYVIRLGTLHLPEYIDVGAVARAQALIIEAVRNHDLAQAHEAMAILDSVEVPQEPAD